MIRRFITWLFLKGGDATMMAMFFAQRVILNKTEFKAVPTSLQDGVKEILIDSGLDFLIIE